MDWSDFLKRVKLIDSFEHVIDMPKEDFQKKMADYIRPEPKNFFARIAKLLGRSERPYLGMVDENEFKIRRTVKFKEGFRYLIRVHGKFTNLDEGVLIESTMNGVNPQVLGLIILKNLLYAFAAILALRGTAAMFGSRFLSFFGFLVLMLLVFLVPYFIMRYSMNRSKNLLRDEYEFISKGPC